MSDSANGWLPPFTAFGWATTSLVSAVLKFGRLDDGPDRLRAVHYHGLLNLELHVAGGFSSKLVHQCGLSRKTSAKLHLHMSKALHLPRRAPEHECSLRLTRKGTTQSENVHCTTKREQSRQALSYGGRFVRACDSLRGRKCTSKISRGVNVAASVNSSFSRIRMQAPLIKHLALSGRP